MHNKGDSRRAAPRPETIEQSTTERTDHLCRVIVENLTEAALVSRDDGIIVYGNSRFAEMMGVPIKKVLGARIRDFFVPGDRERLESLFGDVDTKSGKGEFTVVRSNGSFLPVYLSGTRVDAGGTEGICMVMTDITIRKRAEEVLRNSHDELEKCVVERTREVMVTNAQLKKEMREREKMEKNLRESEEQFRLLIENALDIVMVMKDDATITYAGPSVEKILGYRSKDLLNRSFLDFVDVKDRERVRDRFARTSKVPGHMLSLEANVQRKDGVRRTIEMMSRNLLHDPKVAGIVVNGRDITERKQIEEKLRRAHDELELRVEERTSELRSAYERLEKEIREHKESEEERARLATAIEQGGDCVIITDHDGIIQYANPAFEKVSLYTREEITGRHFDVLKGDREQELFWEHMWHVLTANSVWTGRVTNKKKDGTLYEVERTMSPIRDGSGEITNFVSVERDMTEQVGLEAELRQAQKMQAIGTLAGGIAHDFNNILAAMIGFTELALDDVDQASPAVRHLEQVRKAGYRGRDLIKQILTFSRQGEAEKKAVQVAPIVREVMKLMRASLPTTIQMQSHIETEGGIILADSVQIHQLLINLCTNAGQAMRAGKGVLDVKVSDFVFSNKADAPHPDLDPGAYVRISVTDTGPGIDDLIKDRIFEPFFTTGEPGAAGMGLSVVYGIVKSHNGAITVTSAPGKGSAFSVYFKKLNQAAGQEQMAPVRISKGKGRILFVDDEEALVQLAKQMLERMGYEVVAEKDSLRALKHFQKDPSKFDLVITDQTMPNMTGIELAKQLLSIRKDVPVILCTGFSEAISPESAKALGIREFVMKPIIKNEMAETIRRVLTGDGPGRKR